jgi:hypothetical protein
MTLWADWAKSFTKPVAVLAKEISPEALNLNNILLNL